MFCFFVLNYITRRRNQTSGNFFVNKFWTGNQDITIDELKTEIEKGNNDFSKQISYYAKSVKGSDSYWRSKRHELNTWIAHHIEMKNGAPTYFGTLSCAEYHWPDIIKLIEDRIFLETNKRIQLKRNEKTIVKAMNEYTGVIQEYFQERVKCWFATVGEKIFGIDHYWLRYEFASSRGQIHAHFLAICRDKQLPLRMNAARKDTKKMADLVSTWASKKISLTAQVDHGITTNQKTHPSDIKFRDVKNSEHDVVELMEKAQNHKCS
jgi:hypothetical protein